MVKLHARFHHTLIIVSQSTRAFLRMLPLFLCASEAKRNIGINLSVLNLSGRLSRFAFVCATGITRIPSFQHVTVNTTNLLFSDA